MKTIKLLEKLKDKAVFRVQDIERFANCKRNYAKQVLSRLKKQGYIKHIGDNSYTLKDDIFVIASNIHNPCYISFLSASSFLGYTEQIPNTIQVAVNKKYRKISFLDYKIEFIPVKQFFGYKKLININGEIFIASDEKLLIDSLDFYNRLGNFDEIEKVFENCTISKEKIIEYLKKIKSNSIIKRIRYLLEMHKKIDISKEFKLDKNYINLNPFFKKAKKINKKWRIKL